MFKERTRTSARPLWRMRVMNKMDSSVGKNKEAANDPVLVRDLMKPVISEAVFLEDSRIAELLSVYKRQSDILSFYVTDRDGRLLGQIDLEHLANYIYPEACRRSFLSHGILRQITMESCRQMINHRAIAVRGHDELGTAVEKMIRHKILEIPVIDEDEKIEGVVRLSTLLCHRLGQNRD